MTETITPSEYATRLFVIGMYYALLQDNLTAKAAFEMATYFVDHPWSIIISRT